MKKANEALAYVRQNIEEFKPDTAKLLLGALRVRVPEKQPRRTLHDVTALTLRAEAAEAALREVQRELKAYTAREPAAGPSVVAAARALIRAAQTALPEQRYDESLKRHNVRRAIDDLELALYNESKE